MMKALTLTALLLGASVFAQPALAGSKSATFQATFTVVEACAVESTSKQPVVRCNFVSPSSVTMQQSPSVTEAALAPQQGVADTGPSRVWTVTF
jgi:hypothetical protein